MSATCPECGKAYPTGTSRCNWCHPDSNGATESEHLVSNEAPPIGEHGINSQSDDQSNNEISGYQFMLNLFLIVPGILLLLGVGFVAVVVFTMAFRSL